MQNVVVRRNYNWSSSDSQYELKSRVTEDLDSYGNLENLVLERWSSGSSEWQYDTKYSTHITNQKVSYQDVFWYDSNWYAVYRTRFIYDSLGNPIEQMFMNWDGLDSTILWKEEYTYNYSVLFSDVVYVYPELRIPQKHWMNNQIVSRHRFNYIDSTMSWIATYSTFFNYKNHNLSVSNTYSKLQAVVFPNPADTYIGIEIEDPAKNVQITLIDVYGRLMLSKVVNENQRIDISNLKPGVYTYILRASSGEQRIEKLVIK